MKKIVALVLALVLALSLATVAFGAGYGAYDTTNKLKAATDNFSTNALAKNVVTLEKNGSPATGYAQTYKILEKDSTGAASYVKDANNDEIVLMQVADSACADYAFIDDAGTTTYYVKMTAATVIANTKFNDTKYVATTVDYTKQALADCGDKYWDDESFAAGKTLYKYNGKFYEATKAGEGTVLTTVNNVPVILKALADNAITTAGHTYRVDTATDSKGNITVTGVACKDCGKLTYLVGYEADAIKAYGVGNYEKVTNANGAAFNGVTAGDVWVKLGTAATSTTTTTGVSSAKTFDAGVALYAGMALMSVAGSAVVIGKKKEF